MSAVDVDVAILGCGIVGSYIASRLADAGRRVAVVDIARGPGQIPAAASPLVVARDRPHAGIVDARHHEPGGNSAYWGGAMLRVPGPDTDRVFESTVLSEAALAAGYDQVEKTLGFPHTPRRAPWPDVPGISATEALVLPASSKHVFAARLAPRLDKVNAFFDTRIEALHCQNRRLDAVTLSRSEGGSEVLRAAKWVLCMGVVDSNVFAQRFRRELFDEVPAALGRYLHDHVSVPLFTVQAKRGGDFLETFPPSFIGAFLGVRRFEFAAGTGPDGWNPRAFVHFVFDFDTSPLYADLKRVLALRQARSGLGPIIGAGLSLLRHGPGLVQIGTKRLIGRKLHVTPDVRVSAVLDFETFPHVDNRIQLEQDDEPERAGMHWNLRAQDFDAFNRLVGVADNLVGRLAERHGFAATPSSGRTREALYSQLNVEGKDILHLGGGLPPGTDRTRAVLRPDLTFPGASNMAVVSTAALARASVVNPTHTLLAIGETLYRTE
ncbi:MAG: GMC oxidoreductase [Pseudomonadota bacterium]